MSSEQEMRERMDQSVYAVLLLGLGPLESTTKIVDAILPIAREQWKREHDWPEECCEHALANDTEETLARQLRQARKQIAAYLAWFDVAVEAKKQAEARAAAYREAMREIMAEAEFVAKVRTDMPFAPWVWGKANAALAEQPSALDAEQYPALAKVWDNPEDAVYDEQPSEERRRAEQSDLRAVLFLEDLADRWAAQEHWDRAEVDILRRAVNELRSYLARLEAERGGEGE